jgi:hypothetical protein
MKIGIDSYCCHHIDFNSDEMPALIKAVDSPYFGFNFDTGNRTPATRAFWRWSWTPCTRTTRTTRTRPWRRA